MPCFILKMLFKDVVETILVCSITSISNKENTKERDL